MNNHKNSIPKKVALWLSETSFGKFVLSSTHRIHTTVLLFVLITHSVYWLTAWWSPWPYLILSAIGLWFAQNLLKPWGNLITKAIQPEWEPALLKITIPFIVLNYIAVFACLYMFGTIVDHDGNAISGVWKHFYFSAVTLTTLGYGNLTPAGMWSEIIATIQAIVGFIGFAILAGVIASIVLKRAELNKKD